MLGLGIGLNKINKKQSANDTNVQAFLDVSGITDSTIIAALNYLARTTKGQVNAENPLGINRWDGGIVEIAPIVGGSATPHRLGLKTAANIISFGGSVTHNANGYTGNNINGTATLIYTPLTLGQNTAGYAHYTRNVRVAGTKASVGVYTVASSVFEIYPRYTGDVLYSGVNCAESIGVSNTVTKEMMGISRLNSSTYNEFIQATVNLKTTTSAVASANFICNLCYNINGVNSQFNNDNIALIFIYNQPVTAALWAIDRAIAIQYNTMLSRNV